MTRSMTWLSSFLAVGAAVVVRVSAASASPADGAIEERRDVVTAEQAVPLVTTEAPPTASAQLDLGWSTVSSEPTAQVRGELRLWRELTVLAAVQLRSDGEGARPGIGLAYQLRDPDRSPVGIRLQLAYRPEGLTEPEGEVEATVGFTRGLLGGRASALVTYGQDPEGNERDGELQAAFARSLVPGLAAGATAHGRRSLGEKVEGDRTWDAVAGGFVALQADRLLVQAMAGVERAGLVSGTRTGALGLVGVGAAW